MSQHKNRSTLALISWALYDFASSAYPAIIQTFIFAPFFVEHIAPNTTEGTVKWGFTMSFAGLLVAIGGPIFGAIADQTGRKKRWVFTFTLLCIISTFLLWFVKPNSDYILYSLIIMCFGTIASEFAFIFYNAMLPNLAQPTHIGRWSGWGWSLGYIGGLSSLIVAYILMQHVTSDTETFNQIRMTFPLSGLWYFIFSLPLYFFVKDNPIKKTLTQALKDGIVQLQSSLDHIWEHKNLVRFLVAHLFYIDGLTTLFAFGGVYMVGIFKIPESHVVMLGIAMHFSSGVGAFLFAWIDDLIGPKKLILISILGIGITTTVILLIHTELLFWIFAILLGIFVGPLQAASRSYLARTAPQNRQNEMFGFFAFSGKATAFIGPFLVAWITYITQNARLGLSITLSFFLFGGLLMLTVKPQIKNR